MDSPHSSIPSGLSLALADRYRIERELGAGGMATVYLAEDLRHGRKVAIKVLRPELAAVIGAERFVREIRTIAALQHPHILGLIDSGMAELGPETRDAGGESRVPRPASFVYYVMPFVEGESLRDRLTREKQLPIPDAVRIASEVASALDYAHRHGVIHRDIKPENILLHDGAALVADFGIALAVSSAGGSTRMTETGMSLGTPTYMSPEQAMGEREITARSDVYALGAVTYEMLTGDPPFTGSTAQAIVARVVTESPRPLMAQRHTIPSHVEAAVLTALEKLPADRFASAQDFSDALHGKGSTLVMAPPRSGRGVSAPASTLRSPLVLGLAAALVAAIVLAAMQWSAAHRTGPAPVVRFSIDLPASILVTNAAEGNNVALSADGTTIAYTAVDASGASSLYIRQLNTLESAQLHGTDGAQQPAFSPDGQWIAYLVGNVVWKIPTAGGTPVLVGPTGAGPLGVSWSASGVILVGATNGLLVLPASGGTARVLAAPDLAAGELYFDQPRAQPDGKTALFGITPTGGIGRSQLGAVSLETGKVTRFDLLSLDPLAVIDGMLVYVTPSGALMTVKFDVSRGRILSNPVALGPTITTTIAGASKAAISTSGTLVYQPLEAMGMVGWVDVQTQKFQPLLSQPDAYSYPRLSPDGRRLAMSIRGGTGSDVWIYDFNSATLGRLTNSGTASDRPEWTPDGARVLFRTNLGKRSGIWWQPADLSEQATPLLASDAHDYYEGVISPDGRTLAYQQDDGGATQADVLARAVTGDTASRPVAASAFVEAQPRFSPDGRWIVYATDASGRSEIEVRPFPGPGGRVQVSAGGGAEPVWSRDGRRIFYRDGRNMIAVSVSTTGGFSVTGRTNLFPDQYMFATAPHAFYDVSTDGTRFLMIRNTATPRLIVAQGWASELREQLRGAKEK